MPIYFQIHTEPTVLSEIDDEASYSRSIGSPESGPIDVDIPQFSDDDGEIR